MRPRPQNIFDAFVVILSLVELAIFGNGSGSAISAFRSVRIFRTFRVLRVTRLIRSLQYMKIIITVIINSIQSFIYIFLLLMLFTYIYALLGMQLYGGKFDFEDSPRLRYDSFMQAFMTVFDIMTQENWNGQLVACQRAAVPKSLTLIFLISWLFIGNYVLLNLLMAVLLEGFDSDDVHQDAAALEEGIEIGQNVSLNDQMSSKSQQAQSGFHAAPTHPPPQNQIQGQPSTLSYFHKQQANEPEQPNQEADDKSQTNQPIKQSTIEAAHQHGNKAEPPRKLEDIQNYEELQLYQQQKNQTAMQQFTALNQKAEKQKLQVVQIKEGEKKGEKKEQFQYFKNVECEKALYCLTKRNKLRRLCYYVVKHHNFEAVILFLIVLSSVKLVLDTYIQEGSDLEQVSTNFNLFFLIAFGLESLLKIISFGLINDQNSYLRDSWNQLDFFIVVCSIIDQSVTSVDLSFVKILRLLRTLRPLRFISHNKSMKLIVTALLESASGIINVLIVILLVW